MNASRWWALTGLSAVVTFFLLVAALSEPAGLNYLNPDRKVNWFEIFWTLVFAAATFYSYQKAKATKG